MDTKRIIVLAAIAFIGMQLWTAWQTDYGQPAFSKTTLLEKESHHTAIPQSVIDSAVKSERATSSYPSMKVDTLGEIPTTTADQVVTVKTDVLTLKIDRAGADIVYAALPKYSVSIHKPDEPVVLFNTSPKYRYLGQSTLIGKDSPQSNEAIYQTPKQSYSLADDANELTIDFVWHNAAGIEFIKRYQLKRGAYDIGIEYLINNQSKQSWQGNLITQLSRTETDPNAEKGFFNIHAYFGASISTQADPYQKLSFSDIKKKKLMETSIGGWAAMQQHYFLTAWIPPQDQENLFYTHTQGNNLYTIGIRGADITVPPETKASTKASLYIGPELTEQLKVLAPHLDMTVDYGWLWFISDILYWLLATIDSFLNNWGWSIVLVTVIIKLLFYPLSATSYRSMSKMRALQPKIVLLRERYGDDKARMTQETMALYKREKINPFGGCLPILVQIPIFIALYWVLVESVELRQAPFILWIQDLAVKDPFYILPIFMGVTMIIQQRMNPAPPDPMQAKLMMFLPVVFTLLFMNFPAGLVLYWVVNNSLSILQQWYIMQKVNTSMDLSSKKTKALKSNAPKK